MDIRQCCTFEFIFAKKARIVPGATEPADAAKLAPYREAGIDRVLFEVPDLPHDGILAVLDRNAKLIGGVSRGYLLGRRAYA